MKIESLLLLITIIGSLIVGAVYVSYPGVSLGEASCASLLTFILIYVYRIWNKLNKELKDGEFKNHG